jgi:Na+-transporting NADH:ubiquinone oxidoreductase subunit B
MKRLLRRCIDVQLEATEEGKPLALLRPLAEAVDAFFFEKVVETQSPPYIRDAIDIKRVMMLVVYALIPCIFMAMWNTGLQKFVYTSGDADLMKEYYRASHSLSGYFDFVAQEGRWQTILKYGALAFLPVMIISYTVGGLCEVAFACIRKKTIDEGFLVTGMLFALILPPTIPYWMVAFGVAGGVILAKELFGGTGMNIVNPALCCRVLLFFTFPAQMTGDIWVGTNPNTVRQSIVKMNEGRAQLDGYTQATPLAKFNASREVARIHVDAIGAHFKEVGSTVGTWAVIEPLWKTWSSSHGIILPYEQIPVDMLQDFVTGAPKEGGLGLAIESFDEAMRFAQLKFEQGILTPWNFFFGNRPGSMGETSILACLIGAVVLIGTSIGSWKTMAGVVIGALGVASVLEWGSTVFGAEGGAWTSAIYDFPAYKHLLLGGLAFGTVFMATDPVSCPVLGASRWIYGLLIGSVTMVIRTLNPAYPEGMMLAIILGNTIAPMIDHVVASWYRRGTCVSV